MKMRVMQVVLALLAVAGSPALGAPPKAPFDTAKIEELAGAKGTYDEKEAVFKVSVPRSDLFMHIGGMGGEAALAAAVGKVLPKSKETSGGKGEVPRADIDPAASTLDPKKIDAVLGKSGELNKGVYKVTIGREAQMHGETMGSTMGVNTWAAFAGSDDKAVVDGDFAMLEPELQGVLRALRAAGIDIVAIHQHMSGEQPRVLFLHFWGVGRAEGLAKGIKAALDTQRR